MCQEAVVTSVVQCLGRNKGCGVRQWSCVRIQEGERESERERERDSIASSVQNFFISSSSNPPPNLPLNTPRPSPHTSHPPTMSSTRYVLSHQSTSAHPLPPPPPDYRYFDLFSSFRQVNFPITRNRSSFFNVFRVVHWAVRKRPLSGERPNTMVGKFGVTDHLRTA